MASVRNLMAQSRGGNHDDPEEDGAELTSWEETEHVEVS